MLLDKKDEVNSMDVAESKNIIFYVFTLIIIFIEVVINRPPTLTLH